MRVRKKIWVLYDQSNDNGPGDRHYCWWFDTKKEALSHLEDHKDNPKRANLQGPYRYDLSGDAL